MGRIVTGTYTGTGAAVNVSLGFSPSYVEIFNVTDGDDLWKWNSAMTDGHAIYQRAVTDTGSTGNSSLARITANGVTPYAGSLTTAKGFTAGTALSESGKTFAYLAIAKD